MKTSEQKMWEIPERKDPIQAYISVPFQKKKDTLKACKIIGKMKLATTVFVVAF